MTQILELSDVTVRFGGLVACSAVSFTQDAGEFLAIIGPNGAGKTTVLSAISGVYLPEPGASIRFGAPNNATELVGRRPHHIARLGLARTMQNLGLFHGQSVLENLLMGRSVHTRRSLLAAAIGRPSARLDELEQRRAVDPYLDLLGLREVALEEVQLLPYGYQKRVELGRALLMEPRLLLLDEPFAGMSRPEKQQMGELILRVRTETGTTLLMIEHDMEMVMRMADRIVVLDSGAVIADGTPTVVQGDPAVIDAYLGSEA